MNLRELIQKKTLLFDGAQGTMLQMKGLLTPGTVPELLNVTHPEDITAIHREYVEAGSDVVTTNTFGANALKLKGLSYTPEQIITAAVQNAKKAGAKYVALDIGPTGELLEPMGTLSFEEAYALFAQQMKAGAAAGADLIIIETISDLLEMKAAILAAKENTELPIFSTMTFTDNNRTFTGTDAVTAAVTMDALGVDALGVNCSLGPEQLRPVVQSMLEVSSKPILVQANAGLPCGTGEHLHYDISAEQYAKLVEVLLEDGVSLVGGCCGTDPSYIKALAAICKDRKPNPPKRPVRGAVCSAVSCRFLDEGVTLVGERLNPTGKPLMKEAVKSGNTDFLLGEAIRQAAEGAHVLDLNLGIPGIDEAAMQRKIVPEISSVVTIPLQIDSSKPEAIEAGVRVYAGLPIINSVNGTRESLDAVLPIAAHYGAVLIGLALDETGIPKTVEGRVAIAKRIIKEAAAYGIPKERIIIDALVLTVSAQQDQAMVSLETVRRLSQENIQAMLGVSNISFGIPNRDAFNAAYLSAALASGLTAAIVNPGSEAAMNAISCWRVLSGEDAHCTDYIKRNANTEKKFVSVTQKDAQEYTKDDSEETLYTAILEGRRKEADQLTRELLKTSTAIDIVDSYFVPALDYVGAGFEKGTIFLPQLMQSAAAVQAAFRVIREEAAGGAGESRGKILLATVKGDIHDIGKNIVKMMLQNYNYEIYDLGHDVAPEIIVETVQKHHIPLVGLSALMTTTVENMKQTIDALRSADCDVKIMAGGAVLTPEYAKMTGADFYAKDAQDGVRIAAEFFAE